MKSSATEGKVAQGSAGVQEIRDGKTVEMQAGKNMTIKQTNKNKKKGECKHNTSLK